MVQPPPPGPPPYGQQPPYGGMPPYGGPNPYYAMAPKPGCIPLRPLSLSELIGGSFSAITRNALTVLALAVPVAVIQAVVAFITQHYLAANGRQVIDNTDPSHPIVHWAQLYRVLTATVGLSLIGALFGAVLTGMLIVVVTEDVVGRRADISLVWTKVRSRIVRLVVLSFVVSLASGIGLVFCLAPGIWLWGIWAVAVPALIVENRGIGSALSRSRELVRGTFWRVWGVRALGYLIAGVIGFVISEVFSVIGLAITGTDAGSSFVLSNSTVTHLSNGYLAFVAIGSAVSFLATAPLKAAVDSLLYVDLRMRKENLADDLQRAAALVRRG